jgi:hypothetical protein
MSQALTSFLQ